ncbi:hypothetical protein VN97_g9419 [Penicillium thymicola]|uniref:Uncharacterized protein n=1 Tax=Penicillium thymicola TaxID=293382 RepID=A0AAI9TBF1_PENTH|nr:hypothetical protein VN97_g9419 [Penicillium thymicola]
MEYAVDRPERDQAKAARRQLFPKRRERKKKNPKDKDTEDDGKLSPRSAEYATMIEKMKARQRGEAAHQRFLRRKASDPERS